MTRLATLISLGLTALLAACSAQSADDPDSRKGIVVIEASPSSFDAIGVGSWEVEDTDTHSSVRGYDRDGEPVAVLDNDDDGALVFVQWEFVEAERQERDSLLIHPQDGIVAQTESAIPAMGAVRDFYANDLEVANENSDVPAFSNSPYCTSYRDAFSDPFFGESDPFEIDWTNLDDLSRILGEDAEVCLGCYALAGPSLLDPQTALRGDLGAGANAMCDACSTGLGLDNADLGGLFLCQVEAR